MLDTNQSLQELVSCIRIVREHQKRFWNCNPKNDAERQMRKKLLIECKKMESELDALVTRIQAQQTFLAL